jgi:GntR family transcriptional repressor for pyruvate dehydrogenase complex
MDSVKIAKTQSLRSEVYAAMKDRLMKGYWQEGEKLPSEHEFCVMFGVSRVTIRAALQQLAILGLVDTRHGGGTYVRKFSISRNVDTLHPLIQIQKNQDLVTVMEYRKIVEKGTIGLALEKITPDDIAYLKKTHAIMAEQDCDADDYIQADLDFHRHLAYVSGNAMIIKVYDLINEILATAMRDIVHLVGRTHGPCFHSKIIDALKKGGKAECEAMMEAHIDSNIKTIRNVVNL